MRTAAAAATTLVAPPLPRSFAAPPAVQTQIKQVGAEAFISWTIP
jgi:hypothetical protein